MYAERHDITLTTDASGDATGYIPVSYGRLVNLIYTKSDFADGVGLTITSEATGQTLWTEAAVNASKTVAPRQATHTTAGVPALYEAAGEAVLDHIALAMDRIKIVVASGGNVKSGKITAVIA